MTSSDQTFKVISNKEHNSNHGFTFIDILTIISMNIKILILIPLFICSFTIIYLLFFAKPIYTSSSTIISSSNSNSASQALNLAAQFGISLPMGQKEPKWVYPEILKSRTIAKSVVKQKFDSQEFGPQKSLLQILTYGNKKPEFNKDTLEIMAVDKFLHMVEIFENIKTGILTIEINASEPVLAADVNQMLLDKLEEHQSRYNKTKTSETKIFIEERIVETEKELSSAEERLKVFRDRNRRIENSPALQLIQQRLEREVTVLTGVFTTLKQQLETTKIEEVKESEYVIILDPPEIPLIRSWPNKRFIVILVGFFGIVLGLGLVFIKEYIIRQIRIDSKKINNLKFILIKNLSELMLRRTY